jgi:KipI family sensor histidine kinase inhibitor
VSIELRPYGDRALLVVLDGDEVTRLAEALRSGTRAGALAASGVLAVVPAAASVLVEFSPAPGRSSAVAAVVRQAYAELDADLTAPDPGRLISIRCRYDGPDLDAVADELGESTEAVVRRHTGAEYRVRFCGFSPGFGYLTGLDPRLQLARLATPRAAVPAGSVAVAGEFTGVYPRSSPGGWRLLGRTDAVLFDVDREPPALFVPGNRVRFVAS